MSPPRVQRPAVVARVVVLPFVNLTGAPGQECVSDAMTEELIGELSGLALSRRLALQAARLLGGSTPRASELGLRPGSIAVGFTALRVPAEKPTENLAGSAPSRAAR